MFDNQRQLGIAAVIILVVVLCLGGVLAAVYVYQSATEANTAETAVTGREDDRSALSQQGILITNVYPDSAAARAGLQRGDIILSVDGAVTNSIEELQRIIREREGGDTVALMVLQGAVTEQVKVTLASSAPYLGVEIMGPPTSQAGLPATEEVEPAPSSTPETAEQDESTPSPHIPLGTPAVITGIVANSPAEDAGLQVGDVITAVHEDAILTTAELIEAISSKSPGDVVKLTIRRGRDTLISTITLAQHPEEPERGFLGVEILPEG